MNKDVLIIGAGVAGLTAAGVLAGKGLSVFLAENRLFPGGRAAGFSCKATEACAKCNACLLEDRLSELSETPVSMSVMTRAVDRRRTSTGHRTTLIVGPRLLDPEQCVGCGLCFQACPVAGRGIRKAPAAGFGPLYGLDPEGCLRFQGEDCRACLDACPVGALNLEAGTRETSVDSKAVIMAGGWVPFDPRLKTRYGYGRLPGVVTALELDQRLRAGGRTLGGPDDSPPKRVAFVQCVGSRDKVLGRDYCSRVCCGSALRLARLIKFRSPGTEIAFLYMDIQNSGRRTDSFLNEAAREVELIHGVPGELSRAEDGGLLVPLSDERTGQKEVLNFDLVVLSVGLGPPDSLTLSGLGLESDRDGFALGRPEEGVFVCGAASGPVNLAETRAQAQKAADLAAGFVEGS